MKLYKNVDIEDLRSILTKGILAISNGGKKWSNNKRAPNSEEVVYLFEATSEINAFPQYGLALLEVEVEATENEFHEGDVNIGKYKEFVCAEVKPEQIVNVYIPQVFEANEDMQEFVSGLNVTFVDFEADLTINGEKAELTEEIKEMFGKRTSYTLDFYPYGGFSTKESGTHNFDNWTYKI